MGIFSAITNRTDRPLGRLSDRIGVGTFVAAVAGALSWPTSAVEAIAQHGWGAVALVSVLLASLVLASAGVTMIGYRRLRPLPTSTVSEHEQQSKEAELSSLRGQLGELEGKLHKALVTVASSSSSHWERVERVESTISSVEVRVQSVERLLQPTAPSLMGLFRLGGRTASNRFEELHITAENAAEFTQSRFADVNSSISEIERRIEKNRKEAEATSSSISRAVRARDALHQLEMADEIVTETGSRLLAAKEYQNGREWSEDYDCWRSALDCVDQICLLWIEGHRAFLDIRRADYEAGGPATPSAILLPAVDNSIAYKTAWLAQSRYSASRGKMLEFFRSSGNELPE